MAKNNRKSKFKKVLILPGRESYPLKKAKSTLAPQRLKNRLTLQPKGGILPMTGKELLKLLKKAGWELDRIRGSHHIVTKGAKTLSVPVHGKKDLPAGLLHKIMKEGELK